MAPHAALGRPPFARRAHPWKRAMLARFVRTRLPESEIGIGLTFDDGPSPTATPQVLDRLAAHGLRATFFVVGRNVLRHRSTLRRIHAAGHRIGNHSLTHPRFGALDYRSIRREILNCQHAIEDALGAAPTEFRPPYGRITPGVVLAARRTGLKLTNWSLDTGDWRCRSDGDASDCAEQTLELLRPRDVLVLHDNHPWIAAVLDRLLPRLIAARIQTA